MNRYFKTTLVAAAVASAMVSGISGTASANEYALSHINVTDFVFLNSTPATPISFTFNLQNTAALTGFPGVIQTASCGGTPGPGGNNCNPGIPVLDALAAEIPVGVRGGQNNFAFVGPGAASYASSDSIIRTAQLVTGTPTSVEGIAEVNVGLNGVAQASVNIQSSTTVGFTTVVAGSFDMVFNADPDLRAFISSLPGIHSAAANITTTFTFVSNTDDSISISWSPQGTALNDCAVSAAAAGAGITCTEIADTQDLNRNVATGTNPSDVQFSFDAATLATLFGIHVAGLPIDTYTLALSTTESVNVSSQVPEPASVALVALGLLGMGFGLRRRNRNS